MVTSTAAPDWPRIVPLLVLAACVGSLGAAYFVQYGLGAEPCILCLYQRVPYAVAGVLSTLSLLLPRGAARTAAVAACAVVFLAGGGIAAYHVGIEQHWWEAPASCGGPLPANLTVEELRARLAGPQPLPCDRIDWTFLGLSLTVYNVAVSLLLTAATLMGARLMGTGRPA